EFQTRDLVENLPISFPVALDRGLDVTRQYDPQAVPTLFLIDQDGRVAQTMIAFDKAELNSIASMLCSFAAEPSFVLAERHDGAPDRKPGCTSRHMEPEQDGQIGSTVNLYREHGPRASRVELDPEVDLYEFCYETGFADPLPIIPPTLDRVERMMQASSYKP